MINTKAAGQNVWLLLFTISARHGIMIKMNCGGQDMIEVKEIRKQDYKKARQFAVTGMHFEWYMSSKFMLGLYSRYFWDLELNKATKTYGAYIDGEFVGVLMAEIKGEPHRFHSRKRAAFIKFIDALQNILAGKGVSTYDDANVDMFRSLCAREKPDGEIVFLAADPECKVKGIGTALLSALERDEKGKLVYLYTDDGCTYQFYEHRGFVREEERDIVMELNKKTVPLTCMIYAKRL